MSSVMKSAVFACALFCASLSIETLRAQNPTGSTQAAKAPADEEEILDGGGAARR